MLAEDNKVDQGLYSLSKDNLRPMIEQRNNLLFKARNLDIQDPSLKQQCIDARRDARNAIVIAKSKWLRHIAK